MSELETLLTPKGRSTPAGQRLYPTVGGASGLGVSVHPTQPCTGEGRAGSQATKGSLSVFIRLNDETCFAKGLKLGCTLESPQGSFKNPDVQDALFQTN